MDRRDERTRTTVPLGGERTWCGWKLSVPGRALTLTVVSVLRASKRRPPYSCLFRSTPCYDALSSLSLSLLALPSATPSCESIRVARSLKRAQLCQQHHPKFLDLLIMDNDGHQVFTKGFSFRILESDQCLELFLIINKMKTRNREG